jgi:hypothetical protein
MNSELSPALFIVPLGVVHGASYVNGRRGMIGAALKTLCEEVSSDSSAAFTRGDEVEFVCNSIVSAKAPAGGTLRAGLVVWRRAS